MLQRWQNTLEWLNAALLILLPLYSYTLPTTAPLNTLLLLYVPAVAALVAACRLRTNCRPPQPLSGAAWLEQHLLLALLLTLLYRLYLPLAPFTTPDAQLLWLSNQLAIAGLVLRLYLVYRTRGTITPDTAATQSWLVGYASQSGMALQLARRSAQQLRRAGFEVALAGLDQLTQQQLQQHQKALFVVSTYGEGEPPDNASRFYQLAQQWQQSLGQLQYAVLALGDRSYQQFCGFGHWLDQWLHSREAKALQPVLELDSTERQPQALSQWQQLLSNLTLQAPPEPDESLWFNAGLSSRYIANPASSGLPCYVVKLQAPTALQWQAGDLLEVQPENSKCSVALWLTKHLINGCQAVYYQDRHVPLCWALAELQLDKVLPPAAGEPLAGWLAAQPKLPLRSYSIASIPEEGQLMLLVRQVQQADGSLGIGSGWLTAWATEQQPLQLRLRRHSSFYLPADNQPVIFIANGTGIAGIRALLAQRVKRGHKQNWLLFGERRRHTDFFFAKDIRQWQQQGFITHCDLAFSQDQPDKYYVQHALAAQHDRLQQWLTQGAAIYVCGSLQGMGSAVHQVLTDIVGENELNRLRLQGRYRRDLY